MNALSRLRWRLDLVYALAVVFLGVLALTAWRFGGPSKVPGFELLLFGWLGVVLGRMTTNSNAGGNSRDAAARANPDGAGVNEKIDQALRHIAKVLQTQMADSEAFSERLDSANRRLSQQPLAGPINEIVMALIDDNRDMRDKLDNVRNQLEESRIRVVQLQTNLERAEEAGMRDIVTNIGNRRFFETAFAQEVEKARRTGDDFCVALADLDRFKLVNDRFGHLVGDRILRLFAEILVQNVRGQDKVARFGGEEFALLFPGTRIVDALNAVERIRQVLEFETMGARVRAASAWARSPHRSESRDSGRTKPPPTSWRGLTNAFTKPRPREGIASRPTTSATAQCPSPHPRAADASLPADGVQGRTSDAKSSTRPVRTRPRRSAPKGRRRRRRRVHAH